MEGYTSDKEQIELIRKWWKEYGRTIILSVVVAVVAIGGYRYWQQREATIKDNASTQYEILFRSFLANKTQAVEKQARIITKEYSDTPYAAMAAMLLANEYVQSGHLKQAEGQLLWAIKHATSNPVKQIARIRAARVYLALKKPGIALKVLGKVNDKTYQPAIDEAKGDIYVALNEPVKARTAYQSALVSIPPNDKSKPLLEMKFENLAQADETPSADKKGDLEG